MQQASEDRTRNRAGLPAILALLVIGWAILGWLDLDRATHAGFDTDGNHTIVRVLPGSPADAAGLQRGDVIMKIGTYPVEDAASIARLPRLRAGDSRTFTILRGGEQDVVTVRYGPLPPQARNLSRASSITGACFLLFPLLAFYRRPGRPTRLLMVMGVGLSLAFIDGPHIADAVIRALASAVMTLFVLAGVAAMVQFLLVFPHPRPWAARRSARMVVYGPALLLWALLAWRMLLMPPSTTVLNTVTGLLAGTVFGGYFLVTLFLVLRNYSRTDRAQREALALNGMLWGTVIGLLPVTIAQLVSMFSPQSPLPGQDYYFVSLALVPLSWARSAGRAAVIRPAPRFR